MVRAYWVIKLEILAWVVYWRWHSRKLISGRKRRKKVVEIRGRRADYIDFWSGEGIFWAD